MKIIEKIEIKHFRSFDGSGDEKVEIIDLGDINVFSGKNDSGKSNILRALNLFFNNEISPGVSFNLDKDLSKIQKARSDKKAEEKRNAGNKDVRQKDLVVKIKIYFKKDTNGVLPEQFFVEKSWDKNGLNPNRKHNIKKNVDPKKAGAQEGQLSQFLNSIRFEYVPAVKDRQFFNFLFKKLQDDLFERQDRKKDNKFKNHSSKFNDLLKTETQQLFDEFQISTGVAANFSIPNTLVDFFRTLGVDTENGISLFDRGDGIQARFIPDILNEISKDSKKKVIWGFEEPENSYEPLRCFELAQDFLKYSKEKQIFVTSHSFPFIALRDKGPIAEQKVVSSYRVKYENNTSYVGKVNWEKRTLNGDGFKNDTDEVEKEIGIIETYEKLSDHLGRSVEKRKYNVFVEDEKKQVYKIAWLKLNDAPCTEDNFEKIFEAKSPFFLFHKGNRIDLCKYLDMPSVEDLKKDRIVGVFDFDDAFNDFNGLKKSRWGGIQGNEETCLVRKRNDHPHFYSLLIPVPSSRKTYASKSYTNNYLFLEHLFEDDVLLKIGCHGGIDTPSGGSQIVKINGKSNLWKNLFELTKEDFKNFKPLFDKIEELFGLKNNSKLL